MRTNINPKAVNWFCAIACLLLVQCQLLQATLVISIYNNDAIYLASDSLATQADSGRKLTLRKIFPVTDTCCVSIAGFYGTTFIEKNLTDKTESTTTFRFNEDLETICSNLYSSEVALQIKITNIVHQFSTKYNYVRNKMLSYGGKPPQATYLYFVGYDHAGKGFFGSWCIFNSTNHTEALETVFADNLKIDAGHISTIGENVFFYDLANRPKDLSGVQADDLSEKLRQIIKGTPLPQDDVVNSLLEMFRLHKTHAAILGYDHGLIDEPYVIYRLTKEKIIRLR